MTNQASCGDCGFHHDPLVCPWRRERKEELAREVREKKQALADLEFYEKERASGKLTFKVDAQGGSQTRNWA